MSVSRGASIIFLLTCAATVRAQEAVPVSVAFATGALVGILPNEGERKAFEAEVGAALVARLGASIPYWPFRPPSGAASLIATVEKVGREWWAVLKFEAPPGIGLKDCCRTRLYGNEELLYGIGLPPKAQVRRDLAAAFEVLTSGDNRERLTANLAMLKPLAQEVSFQTTRGSLPLEHRRYCTLARAQFVVRLPRDSSLQILKLEVRGTGGARRWTGAAGDAFEALEVLAVRKYDLAGTGKNVASTESWLKNIKRADVLLTTPVEVDSFGCGSLMIAEGR